MTVSDVTTEELNIIAQRVAVIVKRKVVHTFLSEVGIGKLEQIVRAAKRNRLVFGHNNYTALANLWQV